MAVTQPRRTRAPLLAAAVLVCAVILMLWVLNFGAGRQILSPAGSTLLELAGDGGLTTPAFDVRTGWRVDWESQGDEFSFAIRGDRDFGVVVAQREPGSGVTSPSGEGRFHLEITAEGGWKIRVVQGD